MCRPDPPRCRSAASGANHHAPTIRPIAAAASRIGASSLSFTVSGRNLVTWTNYKGADPELNTIGQFNYSVADFLTQPPVRYFIGRVNVTF